jgi:hypothetical protein
MAPLIAEANGLDKVPHIRDKINELIIYATLIRSGLEAASNNVTINADGMVQPDELYTNAAKYYQAANYHLMVRNLQDIAGALVITSPTLADLENPEVGDKVHKYMRARRRCGRNPLASFPSDSRYHGGRVRRLGAGNQDDVWRRHVRPAASDPPALRHGGSQSISS